MRSGDSDVISERRRQIAVEIERLRAEDAELEQAQKVIARLLRQQRGKGLTDPRARPVTQREFVVDALSHDPRVWLKVSDVIQHAREAWDEDISERSLRPLLTGMKNSKAIVRRGRLIALDERAREAPARIGPQLD